MKQYAILDRYPKCPDCKEWIKEGIHECLIFTNGLPDIGKNHMKKDFEINDCLWSFRYSNNPPPNSPDSWNNFKAMCSWPRPEKYREDWQNPTFVESWDHPKVQEYLEQFYK